MSILLNFEVSKKKVLCTGFGFRCEFNGSDYSGIVLQTASFTFFAEKKVTKKGTNLVCAETNFKNLLTFANGDIYVENFAVRSSLGWLSAPAFRRNLFI